MNVNILPEVSMDQANHNISQNVPQVKSCSLDVIVQDFIKYKEFNSDPTVKSLLCKQCKDTLLYSIISAKRTIDLSRNKLAKIYGIVHVIVHHLGSQNNSPVGVINRSTKFNIHSVHSEDYFKFSQEARHVHKLGGLEQDIKKTLQVVNLNRRGTTELRRPIGIIIHGPTGCGKTSFVKTIAVESDAVLLKVDAMDVFKSELGAGPESLRQKFQKAVDLLVEGPVILFFDEVDVLCPRTENASLGSKQLTSALMGEMDELQRKNCPGLLVLATTNAISSIDPLLRRPGRFDQEVLINVPNQAQRCSILEVLTKDIQLAPDVSCSLIAGNTPGFVGADLQQLCEEAFNLSTSNLSHMKANVTKSHFEVALHKVVPSLKKSTECIVDLEPVQWDEIGGLENVKAEVRQSVEWPVLFPDAMRRMDISPTKGLLLYGPPGCCKTTLVKAAATSSRVSFLSLSGAQVYSPYVGESERIISEAFQKARALAPSILFFDEIESLVGKRTSGSGQSRVQERILSTLLNEMDGIGTRLDHKTHYLSSNDGQDQRAQSFQSEHSSPLGGNREEVTSDSHKTSIMGVMLVGATNRPDMLDAAILRPGRLDRHIYVPPPDLQARKAILQIYTSKMSCDSNLDLDTLSVQTKFYTGADLKNLCKEAGLVAIRQNTAQACFATDLKVSHKHFLQALQMVKASLSEKVLEQYDGKK